MRTIVEVWPGRPGEKNAMLDCGHTLYFNSFNAGPIQVGTTLPKCWVCEKEEAKATQRERRNKYGIYANRVVE